MTLPYYLVSDIKTRIIGIQARMMIFNAKFDFQLALRISALKLPLYLLKQGKIIN